jgi:uncharacterized membrane protein YgcG
MYAKDIAIRVGQSITIEVSNKPYVDKSIPPQSNDYRWADGATIEVHDPEDSLIVMTEMDKIYERPGWYTYRIQTGENWTKGIYRVIVRISSGTPGTSGTSGTSGSPGTSGTSGSPGTSGTSGTPGTSGQPLMSDVKVTYFRLMDLY